MIDRPADVSTQQGDRPNVREIFRFSNWSPEDNLLTTPHLYFYTLQAVSRLLMKVLIHSGQV